MNDIYDKAVAQMNAENQAAHGSAGQALSAGYGYPQPQPTSAQVIEFLTVQLGAAVTERNGLRGRVWQLEQVNNSQWLQRQEASDTITGMRAEIESLKQQLKEQAPEKQFVVIGCFGAGAKGGTPYGDA